jgi:hypothetical protein
MAEIGLQGTGITPSIGKRVTASVPEHMGMCLERQFGNLASRLDHAGEARRCKWRAALGLDPTADRFPIRTE